MLRGHGLDYSREERFQTFLRRLDGAEVVRNFEDAYVMLCTTLNQVEDTMTEIPFAPMHFQTDGRMYPPERDSMRAVPGTPPSCDFEVEVTTHSSQAMVHWKFRR